MRISSKILTGFATVVALIGSTNVASAQRGARNFQQDQNQNGGYNNNGRNGRFNQNGGGFNNQQQGFGQRQRRFGQQSQVADGDYSIISNKSIFLRDRRDAPPPIVRQAAPPLTPQQTFVLTGIVQEDGVYHAYLENIAVSSINQVKVGDSIAEGKVDEISSLDGIVFLNKDGQKIHVDKGSDLTGKAVASVSDLRVQQQLGYSIERQFGRGNQQQQQQQQAPTVAPPPLDPSTQNLSIEERMRLRRAQEGQGIPVAAPQPDPVPETAPAPDPAATGELSNLTVEERLRARRLQETGQ